VFLSMSGLTKLSDSRHTSGLTICGLGRRVVALFLSGDEDLVTGLELYVLRVAFLDFLELERLRIASLARESYVLGCLRRDTFGPFDCFGEGEILGVNVPLRNVDLARDVDELQFGIVLSGEQLTVAIGKETYGGCE